MVLVALALVASCAKAKSPPLPWCGARPSYASAFEQALVSLNELPLDTIGAPDATRVRMITSEGGIFDVLTVVRHGTTCSAHAAATTAELPHCRVRSVDKELTADECRAVTECIGGKPDWDIIKRRESAPSSRIQEYDIWLEAVATDGYQRAYWIGDAEAQQSVVDGCVEQWNNLSTRMLGGHSK